MGLRLRSVEGQEASSAETFLLVVESELHSVGTSEALIPTQPKPAFAHEGNVLGDVGPRGKVGEDPEPEFVRKLW